MILLSVEDSNNCEIVPINKKRIKKKKNYSGRWEDGQIRLGESHLTMTQWFNLSTKHLHLKMRLSVYAENLSLLYR